MLNCAGALFCPFRACRETFIEREPGESANDRNDRAIRVAAQWYREHLKGCQAEGEQLRVVLLTNDLANKQKAEESNLLVYKCKPLFPQSKYQAFGAVSKRVSGLRPR